MEWRKQAARRYGFRDLSQPEWTGEQDIAGKTIFVHWEQGLGDTLQFCRYLPLLSRRGAKVVFSCQDGLAWLMRGLAGGIEVIGQDQDPPNFDYHAALMSLPFAFGTRLATIPNQVPYLAADPGRIAVWRERLGQGGFKIGVAWRGSALGAQHGKAFGPEWFDAIGAMPGVRLISLQKGAGSEQLADLSGLQIESLGEDFDAGSDAFRDTAAVMRNLDLIITTDTSLAHLAGAMARQVWVPLPFLADWRWFLGEETTPWYPTMRLFRQARWDDWSGPFAVMAERLAPLIQVTRG